MQKIILASKSPRRTELLKKFGVAAENMPADIDETLPQGINEPSEIVKYLARKKAEYIFDKCKSSIVIAADTLVFCGNEILGKPKDMADAYRMMSLLSGNTHSVVSGFCIISGDTTICESAKTDVSFRKLTEDEIRRYIATDEPYDKAGGYGIQSYAGAFVSGISGDYYNVVGLPIARVISVLKEYFGYDALKNIFKYEKI